MLPNSCKRESARVRAALARERQRDGRDAAWKNSAPPAKPEPHQPGTFIPEPTPPRREEPARELHGGRPQSGTQSNTQSAAQSRALSMDDVVRLGLQRHEYNLDDHGDRRPESKYSIQPAPYQQPITII